MNVEPATDARTSPATDTAPAVPREQPPSPHPIGNRVTRALWAIVYVLLFRPSPRFMHGWRNLLLRLFGAKLHPTARIYAKARIWLPANLIMHRNSCVSDDVDVYCVAPVTIGEYSTVSQYGYLCAASHDFEDVRHPLTTAPITIGRRCWLAADVFVAPGVTIADGAVVGARSSVFADLPAWTVCAGAPAKPIRPRAIGPKEFGKEVD
jgi:putative colanic acid biosynthesis acetyltransferase WcaF